MTAWILRLHVHDERVLHALVTRRRPRLDRAMRALTHLGDAAVTVSLAFALAVGVFPRLPSDGGRAALALVMSHLAVQLCKRTVNRARPRMPVGVYAMVREPDRFSFPSGHAASSLSLALAIGAVLAPPLAFAVVLLALLVGVSRCYLGVHYPGDVMAGWLLAAAGAFSAVLVLG